MNSKCDTACAYLRSKSSGFIRSFAIFMMLEKYVHMGLPITSRVLPLATIDFARSRIVGSSKSHDRPSASLTSRSKDQPPLNPCLMLIGTTLGGL